MTFFSFISSFFSFFLLRIFLPSEFHPSGFYVQFPFKRRHRSRIRSLGWFFQPSVSPFDGPSVHPSSRLSVRPSNPPTICSVHPLSATFIGQIIRLTSLGRRGSRMALFYVCVLNINESGERKSKDFEWILAFFSLFRPRANTHNGKVVKSFLISNGVCF